MVAKFLLFSISLFYLQSGSASAFKIVINPNTVNGLVHNEVSISCNLDRTDNDVMTISYIKLLKGDTVIVLFRLDSKLYIDEGRENQYQAQGKMATSITESYLDVTLSNPSMEDSGEFYCVLYYLDNARVHNEKRIGANFTVSDQEVKSTLRHLVDQLSTLKSELSGEKNKTIMLQNKIVSQGNELKQLQAKENRTITFTVFKTSGGALGAAGQVIVFNDVIRNEGHGYDSNTGIFTAPVAGYYVFHLTMNIHPGQQVFYDLMSSKGQSLVRINVGDADWISHSGGSCLAKLDVGEEVKPVIRHVYGGPKFYHYREGDKMTHFSGYLLKAL